VEYGNPEDPEDAEHLRSYSPLHNVRAGVKYPPIAITTSDTDMNVVPWHAYKMVARLETVNAPVRLVMRPKCGHGSCPGKTMAMQLAARQHILLKRMLVATHTAIPTP
jgi:prolyl oligopeptidase